MKELIEIIEAIIKYGLDANVMLNNKEKDLERHLIALYSYSFKINYQYDNQDYPDFNKNLFPKVIDNVRKNFPDFGLYHSILTPHEMLNDPEIGTGDAVDDLSDIIYDILEIKWRIENNSESNGLWYFEFIFNAHTQQHLIDLINFMKSKDD